MGLFGSLFTGVSALGAQSQATATISNNIANVNTTGFKRSDASFFSLVTTEGRSSRYSPGTVTSDRIQRVDQQGSISQSTSATDAGISGNGMFAVKRDSDDSALTEFLYTRNGEFSEDAQGFLRNSAGFYLYGWRLDSLGGLPSNQGDLSSLEPINVAFLGGLTRPTNTADLAINLDSRENDQTLLAAQSAASDFQRGLTVYDSLGNAQPLTLEFKKTYGPQGTAAGTVTQLTATTELINDMGLSDGDSFSLSIDGGAARVYEVDNNAAIAVGSDVAISDIGDIIDDINANVAGATAFLGNNGELVIQRDIFIPTGAAPNPRITIADGAPGALGGLGIAAGTYGFDALDGTGPSGTDFDNGTAADPGGAYSGEEFPAFRNTDPGTDPNYNARGWWEVTIKDPNSNTLAQGLINYNRDGTINALPDNEGNVDIELSQINWGNGSSLQSFNIQIDRFSQFASDYTVLFSDQDGAELGLRTGVEIDREGNVVAQFSNGATSRLYKLPLVTFANANGLQEVSGTAYTENEGSGEENLREAGSGGAGFIEPSTLEDSNVDLADEFAKLIVAQRAFSAGTKIINTVDSMTEELLRLR